MSTGQASIWDMDGNEVIGGGPAGPNPGTDWRAVGAGDFTATGHAEDIVWQNTSSGQVSIWEMGSDGTSVDGGGAVGDPGTDWQAIGTGSFSGDGLSDDILFQNKTSGQVSVWQLDGASIIGGGPVGNPGPTWKAIGSDDGGSGILFQNTSGQTSIWDMYQNTITGGGPTSANAGPNLRAVGLASGFVPLG
jgi:hypothetical protein